jgi:glycosyltransferase involved in cell wall biosynthesis
MNVLILNTHNPLKASGAVAMDLFNEFKRSKHEVRLLVNSYDKNYPEGVICVQTYKSALWKELLEKIEWRVNTLRKFLKLKDQHRKDPNYSFFQLNEKKQIYRTNRILKAAVIKPDLIIILFANGFINAKNLYELYKKTQARIFWLMFDMAPFTGGCHYAWDCKGYEGTCGNCPALFSSDPFDLSHKNLIYKKAFLDRINLEILAGSEWQYKQAKMSTLFKNGRIHKVILPIDSSVFKPVDKEKLKTTMKISGNKKIIFFGAMGLTERRKGMQYLIESLNELNKIIENAGSDLGNNILLLVAGKGFDAIASQLPFEYHSLGYLDNNYGIASAFQVADVFICPSIEDSGPMMINQSIMSGTPVVSFDMGVAIDLVINGETGYRAKIKDSEDMANGIFEILKLNSDDYSKISTKCRELALELCSYETRMEIFENR